MATDGQSRKKPLKDRRAPKGTKRTQGPLSKLGSLLIRPLRLQRQGARLRVVLIERRREPNADQPPSLDQMRLELRARLMAQPHEHTARVMRHLAFVHDELGRKGWPGVEALPSQVLGKAHLQAEMLASEEASAALTALVERLHVLRVAAELHEERRERRKEASLETRPDVFDATHEEFEEVERSWTGPDSSKMPLPEGDR